ncbi:hypothetical protein V6Z12_A04G041100 [Gossypium hirsutum]
MSSTREQLFIFKVCNCPRILATDCGKRYFKLLHLLTSTSLKLWRFMCDTCGSWIISSNCEQLFIFKVCNCPRVSTTDIGKIYFKLLQPITCISLRHWKFIFDTCGS